MENQRDLIQTRLIKDYQFVCCLGIVNSCFHIAAGAVWEIITVDEDSIVFPRYGGYLILVAFSKILILVYLLTFYCGERKDQEHLRCLRFIVSAIVFLISIAVIIMVVVKLIRQVQSKNSLKSNFREYQENQFASTIAVSVIDLIATIYCIPVYLFLTISHCRNLGKKQENSHVSQPIFIADRGQEIIHRISEIQQIPVLPQPNKQLKRQNKIMSSQHLF